MPCRLMLTALFSLLAVSASQADELVLNDGTIVSWRSLKDTGEVYEVETDKGAKIRIQKDNVVRFEKKFPKNDVLPLTGAAFNTDAKGGMTVLPLLGFVDPAKAIAGAWKREQGAILTPAFPHGKIVVPHEFPLEYDLQVIAQRKQGGGAFYVGLPAGDRRVMVFLDGTGGVEGGVQGAPQTIFQEKMFKDTVAHQIVYQVRRRRLVVLFDGKPIVDWKNPDYATAPDGVGVAEKGLVLGVFDTIYAITKLTVSHPK